MSKTTKLLTKLGRFLSRDFREQVEKRNKLRKMLARMREQQRKLESELAEEYDPAMQAELRKKIHLLQEQRRKGLDLLKTLRQSHH